MWFRVDNRLIHGQVIESWLPYTHATRLVVCSAALAEDAMWQRIMLLAVPARVAVEFCTLNTLRELYEKATPADRTLVLFADCGDARSAYEAGIIFTTLNIGNLHYSQGKTQICAHIALSDSDRKCLGFLKDQGVTLDFRCVPGDNTLVEEWS